MKLVSRFASVAISGDRGRCARRPAAGAAPTPPTTAARPTQGLASTPDRGDEADVDISARTDRSASFGGCDVPRARGLYEVTVDASATT